MDNSSGRQKLRTETFDYELPEERIAYHPSERRDNARLLIYDKGSISHDRFHSLPGRLKPGSALLFNNTKVIPARLEFFKTTGARIEIFCLEPESDDLQNVFQQTGTVVWRCLAGNLRKWRNSGNLSMSGKDAEFGLQAELITEHQGECTVRFSWEPQHLTWAEVLEMAGKTPLPPYIQRKPEYEDRQRYQTVFASREGAVAAPTASLHFTEGVLQQLRDIEVPTANITLHTGLGTFKPVTEANPFEHPIHREMVRVDTETVHFLRNHAGNIVMAGTTSLRAAESVYWTGLYLRENDSLPDAFSLEPGFVWERQENSLPQPEEVLDDLLSWMEDNNLDVLNFNTGLYILPGYPFMLPSGLITNFHMPKSTLLMLVAAWAGDDWKRVYEEALNEGYRFLSYGDASLLYR